MDCVPRERGLELHDFESAERVKSLFYGQPSTGIFLAILIREVEKATFYAATQNI